MSSTESVSVRALIDFCEQAAKDVPEDDARFYFEQMIDYFRNDYSPRKGLATAARILGL